MDSRVGSGRHARYVVGRGPLLMPALVLVILLAPAMRALAAPQQGQSPPGQQSVSVSQAEVMRAVATAEAALNGEEAPAGETTLIEETVAIGDP